MMMTIDYDGVQHLLYMILYYVGLLNVYVNRVNLCSLILFSCVVKRGRENNKDIIAMFPVVCSRFRSFK